MFYRGISQFGEYCGRLAGRGGMFFHNPWGIVLGALGIILVVAVTVLIVKAAGKNKKGENDEMIELLKSKYAAGEIDEEEYLRKRKILKK